MIDKKIIKQLQETLYKEIVKSGVLNVDYIKNQQKKNPSIYLYYPYLFNSIFEVEDIPTLNKLSIGGFLFYLNILHGDYLTDINDKNKIERFSEKVLLIQALTEQAITAFKDIFPGDNEFWDAWRLRKKEFATMTLNEDTLNYDNFTMEKYEQLADSKVAFAKGAIDACYILGGSKKTEEYNSLLASHKDFSIAYQLCDDINDIKRDIRDDQFNYALYKARKYGVLKDAPTLDIEKFYYSDLIQELYTEAIGYFHSALKKAGPKLKNSLWFKVVQYKIMETTQKKDTLLQYKKINDATDSLLSAKTQVTTIPKTSEAIDASIKKGLDFILSRLEEDHWEEYVTQAGISSFWSTSFISSLLKPIQTYESSLLGEPLAKATQFLDAKKNSLWTFNQKWNVEDADSTNFALLALGTDKKEPLLKNWLAYQSQDGGFSTYSDHNKLEKYFVNESFNSFKGWYSSHMCVSAVSAHVLHSKKDEFSEEWQKLLSYIIKGKNENGIWDSYWWSSPIYSSYFVYSLFSQKETAYKHLLTETDEWMKQNQNPDGSFSDAFGKNMFISGLGLKLLMNNPELHKNEIDKTLSFLLQEQFEDGSWENSHSLQIPHPEVQLPNSEEYNDIKTYGVNIRAREFQRLFSTAVCLNALYSYKIGQDLL